MGFEFKNLNEKMVDKVTIDMSEYEDLLNMKSFIYDNELLMKYEMFLIVLQQLKDIEE